MTTPTINLFGKDYTEADLTQEQLLLVKHLVSLNAKIENLAFEMTQLDVAKMAFSQRLEALLTTEAVNATE